jgi:hypothetical protein
MVARHARAWLAKETVQTRAGFATLEVRPDEHAAIHGRHNLGETGSAERHSNARA